MFSLTFLILTICNRVVYGYVSDWSQYDGRLDNLTGNKNCGRGWDLVKMYDTSSYTRLIMGFFGIVGDNGDQRSNLLTAAGQLKKTENETVPPDTWGAIGSYRNVGFDKWVSNDYLELYKESKCQGTIGGLLKIRARNNDLSLGISIGGWSMSQAFRPVTSRPASICQLIGSIKDFYTRFPSYTHVDIDWEYPNAEGDSNVEYGPEDPERLMQLLRGIKQYMPSLTVTIAIAGSVDKLKAANLRLYDKYVDNYNVMTYDYFGAFSNGELAHHTNLGKPKNNNEWSVSGAVEFITEHYNISSRKINIGYAAYGRTVSNATITSFNPLRGTFAQTSGIGSFENTVLEWPDLLRHYLHFDGEKLSGKNGYRLYHDSEANADYLYNSDLGVFISFDTPRSVYAKGKYVVKRQLGGLFVWTVDGDNGLLVNAANEGLGNTIVKQHIDMRPLYKLPNGDGSTGPDPTPDPEDMKCRFD